MADSEEFFKRFDESFFGDGYNLADMYLYSGLTKENLFKAQSHLYRAIDEFNDAFLRKSSSEGVPEECKMGCSTCCHQTVLATPYEFFYLADFMKNKFRNDALEVIVERAENKNKITSKLKIDELLKFKQPCPLLHPVGKYCRAYQARPMACRIYLSSSVKSCIDDLENPVNDEIYPKLFELPLRAGRMMNEGFHARVRKGNEKTIQAFENTIEEGLLTALKPDSFKKWVTGNKVFRKIETNN